MDMLAPLVSVIATSLGEDAKNGGVLLSVFFAGSAVGVFFAGPLSDNYGRKQVLIISLSMYTICSLFCAFLDSLHLLIFMRFMQAIGAGASSAMTILLISDKNNILDTARFVSLTVSISMLIRLLSPIGGLLIFDMVGWASIFLLHSIIGILLIALFSCNEMYGQKFKKRPFNIDSFLTQCQHIFLDKPSKIYIFMEIFTSIALFSYVANVTVFFVENSNVTPKEITYLFSLGTLFLMTGACLNVLFLSKIGMKRMLFSACFFWVFISGVFFLFSYNKIFSNVITNLVFLGFLIPLIIVRINSNINFIKRFPRDAGISSSLINTIGLTVGAVSSIIVTTFIDLIPMLLESVIFISGVMSFGCVLLLFRRNQEVR
jgi:DHA1 family bicyclomycin/chloramphenicol resistance-like MFS transporter